MTSGSVKRSPRRPRYSHRHLSLAIVIIFAMVTIFLVFATVSIVASIVGSVKLEIAIREGAQVSVMQDGVIVVARYDDTSRITAPQKIQSCEGSITFAGIVRAKEVVEYDIPCEIQSEIYLQDELVSTFPENYLGIYSETEYQENLDLLAHLVYAEGGAWLNPYTGKYEETDDTWQQYVACVVLNRVRSKYFPNTIFEVIHQKGQYACVGTWLIYQEPSEKAWKNAKIILDMALRGEPLPLSERYVFQAEFLQGTALSGREPAIHIGNTYFCMCEP